MKEKKTGLEDFVDRHRGDFDAFEPRPDLWDAIEAELSVAPAAAPTEEAPLRIVKLQPEEEILAPTAAPTPTISAPRRYNYGVAAALALLLLAGLGAIWSKSATSSVGWTKAASAPLVLNQDTEPAGSVSGFGASPVGIEAASPQKRLAVAVERMEDYYATQIGEKKAEIGDLRGPAATAATAADWRQELATLDSTYNQLKVELYRNPEPDVVLEAMNRNMQIRLDILNQQLRLQERMKEYNAAVPAAEGEVKP
ncbi:hypothetical protein [Hymenobacter chitinivorans]|uniref:Anti-sigma factor n=1 Tax=Hymenobacter chitinivorans DSM 11115 TaxID=1121954 RepID=A0A2M9B9W3_9BACT|nr:hypothetical protein [Hymenobacter chitinivorans]PJJ54732.1 hypothetical protein CLV45_3078 [Hymenobacter chitinivorans DSM 11115]